MKQSEKQLATAAGGGSSHTLFVQQLLRLFRGDSRRVMHQKRDGSYGPYHKGPLNADDLERHLAGKISASIYLLDENRRCSVLCFDVDIPKMEIPSDNNLREQKKRSELLPLVAKLINHLRTEYEVSDNAILLEDTGGRGYHIWMFFHDPQPAESVVIFGNEVKCGLQFETLEVFPSSARPGPSGFSKSNVRLPLGFHRKYPESRSAFLDLKTYSPIPSGESGKYLEGIAFTPADTTSRSLAINSDRVGRVIPKLGIPVPSLYKAEDILGEVGEAISLCPALSGLAGKARREGHLLHHERVALALILKNCSDGETRLHEILRYCADYSREETNKHLKSLSKYYPVSCSRLQSATYNVCPGWCSPRLEAAMLEGQSPTPLLFGKLTDRARAIRVDGCESSLLERIASFENLHRAWTQAVIQARERDMFEDTLQFSAFKTHLWSHLNVVRGELLKGKYHHGPFRALRVPKKRGDHQDTRPMCWASPWDSVVTLAILNVIGPSIDSTFHENSLGNRLAHGPRVEGQIFEDWRKQIHRREMKCAEFAEYGPSYHYWLTDISRFYEHVPHDRLMALIRARIDDQGVLDLIQQFLEAEWIEDGTPLERSSVDGVLCGLPQGPALSAFLANLYLCDLDDWLERQTVQFVRYVDDIAMLFETKSDAESGIGELDRHLTRDFGLSLSRETDKTRGPFSSSDTRAITDWVREARYELAKYARRGNALDEGDKIDLRLALEEVAGARLHGPEDLGRLVKYLGFYVANTERLDQPELQQSVYALAQWVLNEERPKHNATSIAIRALIKACLEFGGPAVALIGQLLTERSDEYIKVVFGQEARRFSEEAESKGEDWVPLVAELERVIASSGSTAAAAILGALSSINRTSVNGRDCLWRIALGEDPFLRPRAIFALSGLRALDSTAMARILPESPDEANVLFLSVEPLKSRAVVEAISTKLAGCAGLRHSVPALLSASITVASERGIRDSADLLSWFHREEARNISFYVAEGFVNGIVRGAGTSSDVENAIRAAQSAGMAVLAGQIYDLGRYAGILSALSNALEAISEPSLLSPALSKLPVIEGIVLERQITKTSSGVWLHKARDSQGRIVFHEIVAEFAITAIGHRTDELRAVLIALQKAQLSVIDRTETQDRHGETLLLSTYLMGEEWKCLADLMDHDGDLDVENVASLLRRIAGLVRSAEQLFLANNLPLALLPTPNLHSVVINKAGAVRFANIAPTIIPVRAFIGLKEGDLRLNPERWGTHALGLCFFELATGACAASSAQGRQKSGRLSESPSSVSRGALFTGIVGKATAGSPHGGYDSADFLLKDIDEWCKLETVISKLPVTSPKVERVRKLLNIQLGVDRRAHVFLKDKRGVWESSYEMASYIVTELERGEELSEQWLSGNLSELSLTESGTQWHIVGAELNAMAHAVETEWKNLSGTFGIERVLTLQHWLRVAAAGIEVEALRRTLRNMAKQELESVCMLFWDRVLDLSDAHGRLQIDLDQAVGLNDQQRSLVESNLIACAKRLQSWQGDLREGAEWFTDDILIGTLLLIAYWGIVLRPAGSTGIPIGPVQGLSKTERCREMILSIFGLCCINAKPSFDADVVRSAIKCGQSAGGLSLARRRFGRLPQMGIPGLYSDGPAPLDLSAELDEAPKSILASRAHVLPFPSVNPRHTKGCAFSADILHRHDARILTALSLPPYAWRDASGVVYPIIRDYVQRTVGVGRVKSLISASWGKHTFYLAPFILVYAMQLIARHSGVSWPWLSILDSYVVAVVSRLCLVPFFLGVYRSWRRKQRG